MGKVKINGAQGIQKSRFFLQAIRTPTLTRAAVDVKL